MSRRALITMDEWIAMQADEVKLAQVHAKNLIQAKQNRQHQRNTCQSAEFFHKNPLPQGQFVILIMP